MLVDKECIISHFKDVPYWFFLVRRKGYEIGLKEYSPLNEEMEVMIIVQGPTIDALECTIIDGCGVLEKKMYNPDFDKYGVLCEYGPIVDKIILGGRDI